MKNDDARFDFLGYAFEEVIKDECTLFQGKLPGAELRQAALIGLFYADITYQIGISNFETYVRNSVHEALLDSILKSYPPRNWLYYNEKIDSYQSDDEFLAFFMSPQTDWDLQVMVGEFVSALPEPGRAIARELMGNATLKDIASDYHLPAEAVQQSLLNMRRKWKKQYGEISYL